MTRDAKSREKRADLWEKSVAMTFRDLQWLMRGENVCIPEGNLSFDGNIERALGDGIVSASDMLFLLELKSDAPKKAKEWEAGSEKWAYRSLKTAIEREPENSQPRFVDSMRGHFFLYWSATGVGVDTRARPGALTVSSYLLDALRHAPIKLLPAAKSLRDSADLGIKAKESGQSKTYVLREQVRATRLFDPEAKLILRGERPRFLALGLTPTEMHSYAEWLVERQSEGDLPINVLLVSSNGAICQHLSRLVELRELLEMLAKGFDPTVQMRDDGEIEIPRDGAPTVQVPVNRRGYAPKGHG